MAEIKTNAEISAEIKVDAEPITGVLNNAILKGVTYTPNSTNGVLSWTNDGGLPNPASDDTAKQAFDNATEAKETATQAKETAISAENKAIIAQAAAESAEAAKVAAEAAAESAANSEGMIEQAFGTIDGKIDTAVAALVGGAPETLDTLKELADALNENESMATALTQQIGELQAADEALGERVDGLGNDLGDVAVAASRAQEAVDSLREWTDEKLDDVEQSISSMGQTVDSTSVALDAEIQERQQADSAILLSLEQKADVGADGKVLSSQLPSSLALGETSNTAYRGDRGKAAYDHSQSTGNPHQTTAADVGALSTAHNTDEAAHAGKFNDVYDTIARVNDDTKVALIDKLARATTVGTLAEIDQYGKYGDIFFVVNESQFYIVTRNNDGFAELAKFSTLDQVKALIATEKNERQTTDNALSSSISDLFTALENETIAREQADAAVDGKINTAISALVNSAPETLDTLGELATALHENQDVATALAEQIGNKLSIEHATDEAAHEELFAEVNATAVAAHEKAFDLADDLESLREWTDGQITDLEGQINNLDQYAVDLETAITTDISNINQRIGNKVVVIGNISAVNPTQTQLIARFQALGYKPSEHIYFAMRDSNNIVWVCTGEYPTLFVPQGTEIESDIIHLKAQSENERLSREQEDNALSTRINALETTGGVQGEKGTSFRMRGNWSGITNFVNNDEFIDVVTYEGQCYYVKQSHAISDLVLGANPSSATGLYGLMAAKGDSLTSTEIKAQLLELIYPVGSIYMAANSTSPASFLGGTWAQWGQGRVPVGMGSNGTTTYSTVEATGGSDNGVASHTHTQASHAHTTSATNKELVATNIRSLHGWNTAATTGGMVAAATAASGPDGTYSSNGRNIDLDATHAHSTNSVAPTINSTGTSGGNRMPYITCYMWKRTA